MNNEPNYVFVHTTAATFATIPCTIISCHIILWGGWSIGRAFIGAHWSGMSKPHDIVTTAAAQHNNICGFDLRHVPCANVTTRQRSQHQHLTALSTWYSALDTLWYEEYSTSQLRFSRSPVKSAEFKVHKRDPTWSMWHSGHFRRILDTFFTSSRHNRSFANKGERADRICDISLTTK